MAYYLQFDGLDDYCTLASPILGVGEFSIRFQFLYADTGNPQTLIGNASTNDDIIRITEPLYMLVKAGASSSTLTFSTPLVGGQWYDFYLQRNASNQLDIVDENGTSLVNSVQTNTADLDIHGFGRISATNYFAGGLRAVSLYNDAARTTLLNHWENTSGTGSTLPDTVASNDATLVNFATDDSQWVNIVVPPSLTVTPADLPLTPGGTISGSYSNYETVPTSVTVSDGTNTITIASPTINDNGDGTGTFSGTMPALPSSGSVAGIQFTTDATVELT